MSSRGPLSYPPSISPAIRVNKTFRFTAQSATSKTITQTNLQQLLVVANTAATSSVLFSSIRLRRVECWASPAQGAAPVEVSIFGVQAGPENRKSDVSLGVTPAHVRFRPAKNSTADLWYESNSLGSQSIFTIQFPATATVDVNVDLVINSTGTSVAGPIPAGAVAGTLYGVPLDGIGGTLTPVDYVLLP